MIQATRAATCILLLLTLCGCTSGSYAMWDKLGWAKRDNLIDRVKDAKEELEGAKNEFNETSERLKALIAAADLKAAYAKFNRECDNCEYRANEVRTRIAAVDRAAQDFFDEWSRELKDSTDDDIKRSSEKGLRNARQRYARMFTAMTSAEAKLDPVLHEFKTQLLFIKQNLSASALHSLEPQIASIQGNAENLVHDMDTAIQEAADFITHMK